MSRHDDELPESHRSPREPTSGEEHEAPTEEDWSAQNSAPASQLPRSQSLHVASEAVSSRPSISPSRTLSDSGRRPSQQHHVRFSTDLERPSAEEVRRPNWERRPGPRGLTINTDISNNQAPPPGRSPGQGIPSSLSPRSALSPPSPQSPETGGRSRSRNRGYSLRRTIFAKNIESQSGVTSPGATESDEAQAISPQLATTPEVPVRKSADESHRSTENEKQDVLVTQQDESDLNLEISTTYYSEPSEDLKEGGHFSKTVSYDRWLKKKAAIATLKVRAETMLEAVRKTILRVKEIPPSKDGRHIDLDAARTEALIDERTGKHYIGNSIRSSRYSLWSFFPRQLFAQFTKLANFYFLIVAILQMIPGLSTTGSFTTLVPLLIFVAISMGKEGFDDWRRYRLDKEENNRHVFVLRPGAGVFSQSPPSDSVSVSSDSQDWTPVKWRDIKVGDVIRLERDQPVPADMVLLHADGPNGAAYIETMALDGETNLKNKQPSQSVAKLCGTVEGICSSALHFAVEDPNMDLYKFDGNVTVAADEKLPLTNSEVMYRGSILRNTERAVGMVIYTGEECKIRMNANKNPRIKSPSLQAKVNRVVMLIVSLVFALAVGCTLAYKYWFEEDVQSTSWYLLEASVATGPVFTSFLIMFNTMIPISLYVSMEIVKVAQMLLLNSDIDMYDPETDTPIEARTSTINEELGQVSYVFSDKTGTLTNNSMRFRKMSVAGTAWYHDFDLVEEAAKAGDQTKLIHKKRTAKGKKALSRRSNVSEARREPPRTSTSMNGPQARGMQMRNNRTTDMLKYIQRKPYTVFARKAKMFILAIALCHTCIPEDDEAGNVSFQAASPDELALVMAAQELGYLVRDRQPNTLTIRTYPNGQDDKACDEVYEILDVIDFSSTRKRMSVVVRMPDQRICLFCKGADSILMRLLKRAALAQEKAVEIERRVSKRKAAEAAQVVRRNSEHHSRKESGLRASFGRPSTTYRRSSITGDQVSALRESIDVWLRDRETDGGLLTRGDNPEYYSPRPSAQLGRASSTWSDSGSSVHEYEEELVEEALVVNEAAVFERCFQHLNDFATEGLRTLLYGHRFLDDAMYNDWKTAYHEACTSLVDRQEKIEKVGEDIEQQLELTGATAIEDKLQKGVPEAIDKLRRANIKMWMLTGDKRETAINIGHSCRLVKDYSSLVILDQEAGEVEQSIVKFTADIIKGTVAHSVVVVDGQTLSMIESNQILEAQFFRLAVLVDSVICCRASPKQKAFLVKSIRQQVKGSVTLAIGDGANDIAMIQEAHVGIGITGKEGLQAARISDYSIAQFRFLLKLLLVHGRWNYIRACKYTLGTFWKEMLFYLTQALYQRWNGYTGTSFYESWSLSMFNTLFTSLAVIFLGIFTKDLAASTLLAVPELYTKGQRHDGFNIRLFLGWSFMAACEAMLIYFCMFGLFENVMFTYTGSDIFSAGLLSFTACVVVINTKLQVLEVHNKTYLSLIVWVISVGGWFLWNLILTERYNFSSGDGIYHVVGNFLYQSGRDLAFWAVLLVTITAVIVFEITASSLRALLFPSDVDIFQEYEQDLDIRKRFEEAAASELQQGWDHGKKKSSFELAREGEMEAREQQVRELLARPRVMTNTKTESNPVETEDVELSGYHGLRGNHGADDEEVPKTPRRSVEVHELFSKGFGAIRKGHLK
ncbi:haloacid dehalogenase-like hydrolase [Aspergillus ellipticus CBS 707.79]|uniref:Phospholipid-transporting ATPase n=1 Tax=Aspergillus ellipticus CBS 707.79 TaxID=1448320 RepID=A0A319DH78_9EURO|nr:haloacid dehalogenase-like hydrolase [Aspergillus ellipticus CBS 707.79]